MLTFECIQLSTRGPIPNTSFIGSSLGADVLNDSGHVKVYPTMQLPNHPRIFAAGDAIEWVEQKSARKAHQHALVIQANILTLLARPETTKEGLASYKGAREALLLTNGRVSLLSEITRTFTDVPWQNGGTSYWAILWGLTFGDWFTAKMASKNLYIPGIYKLFDLPPGTSSS